MVLMVMIVRSISRIISSSSKIRFQACGWFTHMKKLQESLGLRSRKIRLCYSDLRAGAFSACLIVCKF